MWRIIEIPKDKIYTFYNSEGGQNEQILRLSAGEIISEEEIRIYKIPISLIEKDEK